MDGCSLSAGLMGGMGLGGQGAVTHREPDPTFVVCLRSDIRSPSGPFGRFWDSCAVSFWPGELGHPPAPCTCLRGFLPLALGCEDSRHHGQLSSHILTQSWFSYSCGAAEHPGAESACAQGSRRTSTGLITWAACRGWVRSPLAAPYEI